MAGFCFAYTTSKIIDSRSCRVVASMQVRALDRCYTDDQGTTIRGHIEALSEGRINIEEAISCIEEHIRPAQNVVKWQSTASRQVQVIDADGMPAAQLAASLENLALDQYCAAARNVPSEVYATVRTMLPGVQYHAGAGMLLYSNTSSGIPPAPKLPGLVSIVCGSGVDVQTAYEAKVTLQLMGGYGTILRNVTPAKLHDVIKRRDQLARADAVIVCCSEQPALAGIILSMVDTPVISIPGENKPHPTLALNIPGAAAVAPGDGVSAASAAARTLHVAAQYIQHRKDRHDYVSSEEDEEVIPKADRHLDLDLHPVGMSGEPSYVHGPLVNGSKFKNN